MGTITIELPDDFAGKVNLDEAAVMAGLSKEAFIAILSDYGVAL